MGKASACVLFRMKLPSVGPLNIHIVQYVYLGVLRTVASCGTRHTHLLFPLLSPFRPPPSRIRILLLKPLELPNSLVPAQALPPSQHSRACDAVVSVAKTKIGKKDTKKRKIANPVNIWYANKICRKNTFLSNS